MILNKLHKETKIFVTGIYGSGKTTYAKEYAELAGFKYVDFDMYFNYASTLSTTRNESDEHFLNIMSNQYITDAIPWDPATGTSKRFIEFAKSDDRVLIVCCICTDRDEWARRIVECKDLEVNNERFLHYKGYYRNILPVYLDLNIAFYDTFANEYITKDQLDQRTLWLDGYC